MMDLSSITNNFYFLISGLGVTLKLAFISITGSLLLGTLLGVLRYSKIPFISMFATIFIETTRSIPLILYIIFIHFSLSPILYEKSALANLLGLNSLELQSATIALVLFTSAYIAEIIRSGLNSVEKEQIMGAKSLGLNSYQIMKLVILPIANSRMLPSLVSQFISLTKDTSLASAIGLIELTRSGEIIYETTHHEFQILCFVALIYLGVCYTLSQLNRKLENKAYLYPRLNRILAM